MNFGCDWRNPSPVTVSPNTRRAETDTMKVPPNLLDAKNEKTMPILRREDLKSKPNFYRAVAEVAAEAGMLQLQ